MLSVGLCGPVDSLPVCRLSPVASLIVGRVATLVPLVPSTIPSFLLETLPLSQPVRSRAARASAMVKIDAFFTEIPPFHSDWGSICRFQNFHTEIWGKFIAGQAGRDGNVWQIGWNAEFSDLEWRCLCNFTWEKSESGLLFRAEPCIMKTLKKREGDWQWSMKNIQSMVYSFTRSQL